MLPFEPHSNLTRADSTPTVQMEKVILRTVEWKREYSAAKRAFGIREPVFKSCLYHPLAAGLGRSLKSSCAHSGVHSGAPLLRAGPTEGDGDGTVPAA